MRRVRDNVDSIACAIILIRHLIFARKRHCRVYMNFAALPLRHCRIYMILPAALPFTSGIAAYTWFSQRNCRFPAALPHIHELASGIAAYTCTCQRHCRIYMNLAAALPHIHELVSGIAAYTYTSSRVNVSSAATTVQVVALHSKVFSASMAAAFAFFTDKTRRPGTRMPTKRAGGWLEEGANGRRAQYRRECRDLYVPHKKRFGPTDPDRDLNHLRVGCACTYTYIELCI